MQTSTISIAKARASFSDLVNRVAFGRERVVVERRGKPLATLISADEYEEIMQLLGEEGVRTTVHGIPVRVRYDDARYFVDDDIVDLYGTGVTLAEAQEDYWLAVQEAHADLSANEGQLAPYLQEQLAFLRRVVAAEGEASQ